MAESLDDIKLTRIPPQSMEAEQSTLGSMLLDRDQIAIVLEILRPDDFYPESHRIIYDAIIALFEKGDPVDMTTVSEQLNRGGALEKTGGTAYLATLMDSTPTPSAANTYARIVREKSMLRRLIKAGGEIILWGYEQDGEAEQIINKSEKVIMDIAMGRSDKDILPMKVAIKTTFDSIAKKYRERGGISGLATGLTALDELTSGLQPSDLIIVAARPSVGKTTLALKIAEHVSINLNKGVGVISLEMSAEQLVTRMLCSVAHVDASSLRKGFLTDKDWEAITHGMDKLSQSKLVIVDAPMVTSLEVRAKARRMQKEHGIELLIIDYLQLMAGKGTRRDNRVQEISDISREMKLLAREINLPIILISQLSRAPEQRPNKRPLLSDLRDSGAIEQDADLVLFLYREGYYKQHEEGEESFELPEAEKTEISLAKHRNGQTGKFFLTFVRRYATFENYIGGPEE